MLHTYSSFDSWSLLKKVLCTLLSHQTILCSENFKKVKNWHLQNDGFSTLRRSDILDSDVFCHWKLTLKVRFRHFLVTHLKFSKIQIKKNLQIKKSSTDFWAKPYSLLTLVLKTPPLNHINSHLSPFLSQKSGSPSILKTSPTDPPRWWDVVSFLFS